MEEIMRGAIEDMEYVRECILRNETIEALKVLDAFIDSWENELDMKKESVDCVSLSTNSEDNELHKNSIT
jgi:hypothetical protein